MPLKLSEETLRLVEGKNFAFLAIVLPDGSPHVTPVWIDHEGDLLLVNTALGRVKQKHAVKGTRVSIAIADQNNMYDRVVIHGRVVDQAHEGADALIDKLANKYTGWRKEIRTLISDGEASHHQDRSITDNLTSPERGQTER